MYLEIRILDFRVMLDISGEEEVPLRRMAFTRFRWPFSNEGGEYPVEFGGCTGIFTNLAKFFTILTVLSNIFGYETDNNSCVLCVSRFGGSECAELEAV